MRRTLRTGPAVIPGISEKAADIHSVPSMPSRRRPGAAR